MKITKPFWIAGGAVLAVIIVLIVGVVIAQRVVYTPQAAVRQYFAALQHRDTATLLKLQTDLDQQSYAIRAFQSDGYQPPENVRIENVTRTGRHRSSIEISYTIGGQPFSSTITVVQQTKPNIALVHGWRPIDGMGGVELQATFFASPKINNQPLPQNTDVIPELLPGSYRVTNSTNPLAEIPAVVASVPVGEAGPTTLRPHLKPDAATKINPLVTHYVDRCVRSASAGHRAPDCGFLTKAGIHDGELILVGRHPTIDLTLGYNGITVSTTHKGSLKISGTHHRTVAFSIEGFAYLDQNNRPTFSPKS